MYLVRTRTKKERSPEFSKRSLIRSMPSQPRARNSPFHIMHGSVPIPIPRPHTEEPPTKMTPENWYDVVKDLVESHVVKDL